MSEVQLLCHTYLLSLLSFNVLERPSLSLSPSNFHSYFYVKFTRHLVLFFKNSNKEEESNFNIRPPGFEPGKFDSEYIHLPLYLRNANCKKPNLLTTASLNVCDTLSLKLNSTIPSGTNRKQTAP